MKAEDLMIGDWVNIQGENCYVTLATLYTLQFTGKPNNIRPIPLTTEILEKNGFTSTEDQYNHKKHFLLGKNEYNCDVYWDGLSILLVEADYEPTTYAYVCEVNYVHELQHALKLCGIKKEIVL